MFESINRGYMSAKRHLKDEQFIMEAATEEMEDEIVDVDDADTIDTDSVPTEVYKKIDKQLDAIVNDPNYDDDEAEEMVDDDDDDVGDNEVGVVVDEAVNSWNNGRYWYDDEGLGHPNLNDRSQKKQQPNYYKESMVESSLKSLRDLVRGE